MLRFIPWITSDKLSMVIINEMVLDEFHDVKNFFKCFSVHKRFGLLFLKVCSCGNCA